uniref:C2H2-type domain-containing protein n=1 Tax=Panagrolaimus davidi TaxID=227884 RepID=A0A914QLR5_9BILA
MSAECQICNKTFTKRGLPSHIRQKHPATDDLIDSVLKEPETINSKPKNPEKNAGSESKNADKSIKLQQQESEKAVDSQPKESESKTNDLHWLDISTEDGTVISYNVRHKRSQKGYYKLDESSGKFVETDFDESAEWFRVTCKYCGGNFNKWNLRKHYIEAHLQANKKNATFPNIFNIQSTSFAGTLPSSDSWPIDFSLVVQDDALLKYDKISYSSFFTTDSNFESSNELLKCFKYSVDTEHLNNSYSFNYTCPLCNEKFACVSVNLMKLVALVHLRVRHRDDRLLVKMCEDEM